MQFKASLDKLVVDRKGAPTRKLSRQKESNKGTRASKD